jgi:hypothetical protein
MTFTFIVVLIEQLRKFALFRMLFFLCDFAAGFQGGEGSQGVVCEVQGHGETWRCVLGVRWDTGKTNNYRLGVDGKVDVHSVEPVIGGFFYYDHLPQLGE